jgi:hypothetical protein
LAKRPDGPIRASSGGHHLALFGGLCYKKGHVRHPAPPMKTTLSLALLWALVCALVTSARAASVTVSTTTDEVNGNTKNHMIP